MFRSDERLRIRLDSIREELNSYIDIRLVSEPIKQTEFPADSVAGAKKGGVSVKFLQTMPFSDDVSADKCITPPTDRSAVMCRPAYSGHPAIDAVLATKEESFSEMLLRLIDEKKLKDSVVYKNANIDRRLFSKIRGDENYVPSKKTAISFCFALQLTLDEAKKLLETAGYTLSASSRFDLIIMYLIEHREYNIHFANIVLDEYGEGTLSR